MAVAAPIQAPKKYYVYTLAYPDGQVFYVGKGSGKRSQHHERDAKGCDGSHKSEIIREIWKSGGRVKTSVLYETDTEREALSYEQALIMLMNADASLANVYHGNRCFSPTSVARSKSSLSVDGERYYTAAEAMKFLGISRDTFYRRVKGRLQVYHYGVLRREYFREADLEQYRGFRPAGDEEREE